MMTGELVIAGGGKEDMTSSSWKKTSEEGLVLAGGVRVVTVVKVWGEKKEGGGNVFFSGKSLLDLETLNHGGCRFGRVSSNAFFSSMCCLHCYER